MPTTETIDNRTYDRITDTTAAVETAYWQLREVFENEDNTTAEGIPLKEGINESDILAAATQIALATSPHEQRREIQPHTPHREQYIPPEKTRR